MSAPGPLRARGGGGSIRRAMASPLDDPALEALLERLHAESDAQVEGLVDYFARRAREGTLGGARLDEDAHRFLADQLVALDREKALLCYQLCRALRARTVVEAGTSHGVSTLYLAAAVRDNGGEGAIVIGTEYEPAKAKAARANFEAAGLSGYVELREGDLRETLRELPEPVDFLLLDVWEVALPALERVEPRLRPGAIVACDNTAAHAEHYRGYFRFLEERRDRFRTMTLPFEGGLELTVRV